MPINDFGVGCSPKPERNMIKVPIRRYWTLFSRYLKDRKGRFVLLAGLLLGGIGLQLAIPQVTRLFIDLAEAGAEYRQLLAAAIAFIAASVVQQAVTVLAHWVGEIVAWGATNDLRLDLARHCLGLDMSFHNERSPGDMIERIDGDLLTISQFFSQLVVIVIGSVLLLIGILIALAVEDIRIGGVFAVFASATLYLFFRLRNISVPFDKARRDKLSELFAFIEERLGGTEDIRASGAVDYVMLGLYKVHHSLFGIWKRAEISHVTIRLLAGISMTVGFGIAFVAGYYFYRSGSLSLGAVYLIIHYTQLLARPIRMLTQQVQALQEIGANVERVNDLMQIESRIVDPATAGESEVRTGPAAVEFRDVTFGYSEEERVIHDVSIELPTGCILGVLGRTGSGKTTMARLLFRLYDPQKGEVLVDGKSVRSYRLEEIRKRVAMVTQDVQLFQATVRDNLTFFDRSVPDDTLFGIIEDLGLADWFHGLPDGLATKIEAEGKGLSAGEAQLLAFTRIFLRDPGLVILDEASSRLDPATEGLIEKVVDRLLVGRSAIIIAHRLHTVNRADSILILEEGSISETGERAALAADPKSRFHQLLQTGLEDYLA